MTRSTSSHTRATDTGPQPAADVDRYATDDEFQRAYELEQPRWAHLADRLK